MSLDALSRYDDAEDEIQDEDHDLILSKNKKEEHMESDSSSRPSSVTGRPKGVPLVSYGRDYSDDEATTSEDEDENEASEKTSMVNLGLYDGANALFSAESASPNSVTDSVETNEQVKETSDGVQLPPEPEGRCSKSLQEKIAKMIEKKNNGMNVNEYVQRKKEFRNPSIYEKLVSFIGIDEHGTNFPKHLYDPSIWGPESFYDALAKAQKEHHDKKEKERLKENQKRTQVEFVAATKKALGPTEKKSKWDVKVPPTGQQVTK